MNVIDTLSNSQPIFKALKILRRRRLAFFLPFLIVTPAVIAGGTFLPKLYRASTTILVEPQKIPRDYVKPLVSSPIEQRLNTITQQITSRSRLLKIITELNLAPDAISPLALEEIITAMQNSIEVRVKGTSYFQIAYMGKDPQTVMLVTNKIASLFIEENLRVSERLAQTTTEFISEELEKVQRQLEVQEQKLQEFKQQHMGELPDQEEANLRALDRFQLQLQNNAHLLRSAEEREMLLQKQLFEETPFKESLPPEIQQDPLQVKLAQLKEGLTLLQTRYSDEWPKVKQLKQEIASLEAGVSQENPVREEFVEKQKPVGEDPVPNPIYKSLALNLEKTRREIAALKETQEKLDQEISFYRARVENIPRVEQALISLTRNYEMTKNKYESLLNKKLEAKLSESLENKQKGETFKILDAAEIPLMPYKPNIFSIIAWGVFIGLGFGAGTVWLAETLDLSFREIDEVEDSLGITVIGMISNIATPIDIRRHKWKRFAMFLLLGVYLTVISLIVKDRIL